MHVPCMCHVCAMQHAHAHAVHMPCDAQASTREHALRCMARVGVADLPWRGIIDTRTCRLETKHSPSSFQACNPMSSRPTTLRGPGRSPMHSGLQLYATLCIPACTRALRRACVLRVHSIVRARTPCTRTAAQAAMDAAGVQDPSACTLCDDSVKNIVAAHAFGWRTVLVGTNDRDSGLPLQCEAADLIVPSLHSLAEVAPELFS